MKTITSCIVLLISNLLCVSLYGQQKLASDSLGLPGDNLNLYAVLDIFQKSETLEGFEKTLNNQDSKVNNLDLNGDNKIDYIEVIDNVKGTSHAILLQVAVNQKENQDVAVIDVQRNDEDRVQIQIIGNERLYGKNYIVEPKQTNQKSASAGTPNPGYSGGSTTNVTTNNYTTNNYNTSNNNYNSNNAYGNGGGSYYAPNYWYPVSSWSIIRYMYYPSYVVYVSPWSWGYYPGYWNPWAPLFWHSYYYGCIYPNYGYYNDWCYRSTTCRNNFSNGYYGHRREESVTVTNKQIAGEYAQTYSRPDLAKRENNSGKNISIDKPVSESRNNNGAMNMSNHNGVDGQQKSNVGMNNNTELEAAKYNSNMAHESNQPSGSQQYNQVHQVQPSLNSSFQNNHSNGYTPSSNYSTPKVSAPQHNYSAPAQRYSAPSGAVNHGGGGRGR